MRILILSLLLFPLNTFASAIPDVVTRDARVIDEEYDSPSKIVQPNAYLDKNLGRMAQDQIFTGQVKRKPWSDRTWGFNKGLLTERYTDKRFRAIKGWTKRKAYSAEYSTRWMLRQPAGPARDRLIATLSPVEKYDLIMGTLENGLADNLRAYLNSHMDSNGAFPTWWGICEGSAAASMAYPEPVRKIIVHSEAFNIDVPFYTGDIKGLASLFLSTFNPNLHIPETGIQCGRSNTPPAAARNACFDTNPGTFHISLTHFLGRKQGLLFADLDAGSATWNYPLIQFTSSFYRVDQLPQRTDYFPPRDYLTRDLRYVLVPARSWRDVRAENRAPGTAYVVGVVTSLVYGKNYIDVPLDGSLKRVEKTQVFAYELELDSNLNILGGEWVSSKHPDLLWALTAHPNPISPGDERLGSQSWDAVSAPAKWQDAALLSAKQVVPLRAVVEGLVERSSR